MGSLPSGVDSEWKLALRSVLYGGELLADEASCYGAQQKARNRVKRKEYARRHGNGEQVTEFSAVRVAEPRPRDARYVPSGAVLPVAPESGVVLPVMVSADEVDWAMSLLAEFPAEPAADRSGDGVDVLLDPGRVRGARERSKGGSGSGGFSVLFVSDTHLGYENRVETGSGKTVPWVGEISSESAFSQVALTATMEDVDAVVHTGDILDHEVDANTLEHAEGVLASLSNRGIPVYCILGTHDHQSGDPRYRGSVDGVSWLKKQVQNGYLTELTTNPSGITGESVDMYGVSAKNVGLNDVGSYKSLGWGPSEVAFGASSAGRNVLCLHDGVTPYRGGDADVDLDRLLGQSRVSFDCVLVGDEHRPKNEDFDDGYAFETGDGTPVFYTGPAVRVSEPYRDRDAFVTELTISETGVTATRHPV